MPAIWSTPSGWWKGRRGAWVWWWKADGRKSQIPQSKSQTNSKLQNGNVSNVAQQTKRMKAMTAKLPKDGAAVPLEQAVTVLKQFGNTKFDQSVEIAMRLGVDAKQADQIVRGSIVLPHGIGKSQRVVVFAKGDLADQAKEAGADLVGADDLAKKIKEGWTEFDVCIAAPEIGRAHV